MEHFAAAQSLLVRQKKEMGEILTGFEQRNKYVVTNPAGGDLCDAVEEGGSTLARLVLRNMRPFELHLVAFDRSTLLHLQRPFRWYFHELRVRDGKQRLIGNVKRQFSALRRVYGVHDASGREMYRLYGPLLHPWTFEIRQGDRVAGRIVKKWGGAVREAFTEADTFGVTFPTEAGPEAKAVLLGAVFLIDFVHFESSSG